MLWDGCDFIAYFHGVLTPHDRAIVGARVSCCRTSESIGLNLSDDKTHTLMKSTHRSQIESTVTRRTAAKQIRVGLTLMLALGFFGSFAKAAVLAVDLGVASNFAVLAGAGITIGVPVASTTITGDIGSFATTTITGLANVNLIGVNHAGDSVTQQAKFALSGAYAEAMGRSADVNFPVIHEVGGLILVSGVYNAPSSLGINGVLTLDGVGDPNAVWIFQMGSTLITGINSSVSLINGAQANNVFWQVGSSATLGAYSDFKGTVMANESITVSSNAAINGRVLALGGAVTLESNQITIPETGSSALVAIGLTMAMGMRRRKC